MDALETYKSRERIDPSDKRAGKFLTREGTLAVRLFTPLNPVIITGESAGLVVPSQIAVIELNLKKFKTAKDTGPLLHYILYYLSQDDIVEKQLKTVAGAASRKITIGDLKNFTLPLPPIDKISKFCSVYERYEKRRLLMAELDKKYREQLQSAFAAMAGGGL
jgi:restriction endonuclease S subunit